MTADHYDVGCDFGITTRKDGAKPQDPMSTLFHKDCFKRLKEIFPNKSEDD